MRVLTDDGNVSVYIWTAIEANSLVYKFTAKIYQRGVEIALVHVDRFLERIHLLESLNGELGSLLRGPGARMAR